MVGAGQACEGNIANPATCAPGYYCAPSTSSTLPSGDVGGTCIAENPTYTCSGNSPCPAQSTPSAGNGEVTISRNFGIGASGSDVSTLQAQLISLGFLQTPTNSPTGYFGALTRRALKQYQAMNGISQTGYVGPMTRALFNSGSASGGASTSAGASVAH